MKNFNNSVFYSVFPSHMKNSIITPVYKKPTKTSKDNYRPVPILSNISKIYERSMIKQRSEYFEPILSKFQCGFRKGFSAQHCLLSMVKKWKTAVNNKTTFGALLTNLFREFDCLSHDLLLAKLNYLWFQFISFKADAKLFIKQVTKN